MRQSPGPAGKLRYPRAVEACPGARDRAIALLPPYGGTRIAEIRALDVAGVRLSARKGEVHLVGKGEKSRTVPVHPKLRGALAAWLAGAGFQRVIRRGMPEGMISYRHDDGAWLNVAGDHALARATPARSPGWTPEMTPGMALEDLWI
jgi:integrase